MSEEISNVRALVTGATSGLGRAMAAALGAAGARVAITGRELSRAREVATTLAGDVQGFAMDVRDPESVQRSTDEVYSLFGEVDLLVCNAGIGMRTVNPQFLTEPRPFWHVSPQGFRDVVDTKVNGTFLVARCVVPRMLRAKGGRVVVISMNTETMTRTGFAPYGPSGAGVEALAQVMAADLATTSVRLNVLLPGGATDTGMIPDDASAEVRSHLLDPGIMGPPIVWLASEAARDVHAQRIIARDFEDWRLRHTR